MGLVKITRNFQITIPKDVRELKDLKIGDKVFFAIEGDHVGILKVHKNIIQAAAGLWKDSKETGVEYERTVRLPWRNRLRREGI